MKTSTVLALLLAVSFGALPSIASAYQRSKEEEEKWVKKTVYYAVGYADGVSIGRGGPYETEAEATKERAKMMAPTNVGLNGKPYYDKVEVEKEVESVRVSTATGELRRTDEANQGMGGARSRITKPDLKTVDPGPSASSKRAKPSSPLLGKSGKGTIAGFDSNIEVKEDGSIVFSGKVSGKAQLDEKAEGVVFESDNAKYVGQMDGNVIRGTRQAKDKSGKFIPGGTTNWQFTLTDEAPPMEKGQAYNPPKDLNSSFLTRPIEPPATRSDAAEAKFFIETLAYYTETKEAIGGGWIRQSKTYPQTLEAAKASMKQQMAYPQSQDLYRRTNQQWRIVTDDGTVVETASPYKK